jgi:hypothetical protein
MGFWRRRPVSISSTFSEMDDESDLVAHSAIPTANELLKSEGILSSFHDLHQE